MNFFPGISGRRHVVYCPLPLYHSLAGNGGTAICLLHGHSMVIKAKFSASEFWPDVVKHKCTVVKLETMRCVVCNYHILACQHSDVPVRR